LLLLGETKSVSPMSAISMVTILASPVVALDSVQMTLGAAATMTRRWSRFCGTVSAEIYG
jgi:hypothetical protein